MLPDARKKLGKDADEMGPKMQARKEELLPPGKKAA